jgi:hypothetical protein
MGFQFVATIHEPLGPPFQVFCANAENVQSTKHSTELAKNRIRVFIAFSKKASIEVKF